MIRTAEGNRNTHARAGITEYFRTAWSCGDVWSRRFVGLFIISPIAILGSSAWVAMQLLDHSIPVEIGLSIAVAEASGGLFLPAWIAPLYNPAFIRENIRKGWLGSPAYFDELMRYVADFGSQGRMPGTIQRGLLAWVVYYALMIAALPFGYLLSPIIGWNVFYAFLGIDATLSIVFMIIVGLSSRRGLLEAERRGYALLKLYPRRRGRQ